MATWSMKGINSKQSAYKDVAPTHKLTWPAQEVSKASSNPSEDPVYEHIIRTPKGCYPSLPEPTLFGMMSIKRLARQMASKAYAKRSIQPTYRMEPTVRFDASLVHQIIEQILDIRLRDFMYSGSKAAVLVRVLSEEIKNKIKLLQFERYKLVCMVTIGQHNNHDLRLTSRCVWDLTCDNSVTVNWQNTNNFCCVVLYAVYHE